MRALKSFICEHCGIEFKAAQKTRRFCSNACCVLWKKERNAYPGCFKKGSVSWNKDRKGTHFSPETEFKPGSVPANKCIVGTTKIRTRRRDGQSHAWIKVAEPNKWKQRHRLVWEETHGSLPKGFVIHRLDDDSLNDEITNLVAMSRADHMMLHMPEFAVKLRAAQSRASKTRWEKYRADKKEKRESQYDTYYWQTEGAT